MEPSYEELKRRLVDVQYRLFQIRELAERNCKLDSYAVLVVLDTEEPAQSVLF